MERKIKIKDLDNFKCYLIREEKSRATVEKYQRDLKLFYQFLPADKIITKERVLEYKEYLKERYLVTSINSMLAALNHFLAFKGWDTYRVKRLKTQRMLFRSEEKELSKMEYSRLLSAAKKGGDEQLYLIMITLCSTGIRIGELRYITVESVKKCKAVVTCKNKTRLILIPDTLRKLLNDYIQKNQIAAGAVFISRNGKAADRSNIWKKMKKLSAAAGVPAEKIYPHNLRHLFARTYYQKEKDIVRLADILGHSNVETTRIYTISSGKEHQQQISSLGLVI